MAKITREEVLKLAKTSRIHIDESEIVELAEQLKSVLDYAECVGKIAGDAQIASTKNINVFRPDVAIASNAEQILAQAPQMEDHFFVVLPILDK
jgi:aspartyl/glutamyl-tRNA(Asn/Gln) amidotransferase C subunit